MPAETGGAMTGEPVPAELVRSDEES
jgi:hypothetical protein